MKKILIAARTSLSAAAVALMLPVLSFAGVKSIYGGDDRQDLYEASSDKRDLSEVVLGFEV